LVIAQRQIHIKFTQSGRKSSNAKPLPESIKTIGDWIKVKRLERNLSLGHVALKMGIAASLVCAWENCTQQPEFHQFKVLALVLDFNTKDIESVISTPQKMS